MNDRYLYRAKRIDNGEWVQGYLFDNGLPNPRRIFVGGLIIDKYNGTSDDKWNINGIDFDEIDPSTICQCVPSCECSLNEKPIWENDIVTDGKYIGVVKFGEYWDKHIGFYIEWKEPDDMLRQDICYWLPKIKAIGNIFDNPELLEVEE